MPACFYPSNMLAPPKIPMGTHHNKNHQRLLCEIAKIIGPRRAMMIPRHARLHTIDKMANFCQSFRSSKWIGSFGC